MGEHEVQLASRELAVERSSSLSLGAFTAFYIQRTILVVKLVPFNIAAEGNLRNSLCRTTWQHQQQLITMFIWAQRMFHHPVTKQVAFSVLPFKQKNKQKEAGLLCSIWGNHMPARLSVYNVMGFMHYKKHWRMVCICKERWISTK